MMSKRQAIGRIVVGTIGAATAIFNSWQSGVAGYKKGEIVWGMVYVAWLAMAGWGFHDYLLRRLKKI